MKNMINKLMMVTTLLSVVVSAPTANAVSMTPMRGEVKSLAQEFAIRVHPKNTYQHRIKIAVKAYDQDFKPVAATVVPATFTLGAGTTRPVLVKVNFNGNPERKIRICSESIPFPNQQTLVRVQICGKFIATHLR